MITYDDFIKMDIRIGTITVANKEVNRSIFTKQRGLLFAIGNGRKCLKEAPGNTMK